MDPEVQVALGPLMAAARSCLTAVGDWHARRVGLERSYDVAARALAPAGDVQIDEYVAVGVDGTAVPLLFYRAAGADQPRSAALYLHGGGMIAGWHPIYDLVVRAHVAASGVPMLAVDYRVAPEHPGRLPVEDCYTGLVWLAEHASDLGIDPTRIAVLGGSAGGGLARCRPLARDRCGPHLAQQLLLYPMLDDRTVTVDPSCATLRTGPMPTTSPAGALCWERMRRRGRQSVYRACALHRRVRTAADLHRRRRARHLSGREHRVRQAVDGSGCANRASPAPRISARLRCVRT